MGNILSTFPKKRKRRVVAGFMGTYIPKSQADYVTLFCNAFETPKIGIMKTLLTSWIQDKEKVYTTDVLERLNAEKAYAAWKNTEGKSFDTFLKLLQFELKRKKLDPDVVGRILNLVEDEKNKDQTT